MEPVSSKDAFRTPGGAEWRDTGADWLRALRAYLAAITVGSLAWEGMQLPLYTTCRSGTPRENAVTVVH